MAAVIAGNGLGLFDNRLTQWGLSQIGQGGNGQFVNIATGNLVLQGRDEQLVFRGLAIAQSRTYNSLGTVAQAGSDGWTTSFERTVELYSGTLNTAGSTVRRSIGDGSWQDFTWSASAGSYVAKAGDGADDTLAWDSAAQLWTWREGSTRLEEDYDGASGRLLAIRQARSDAATPIQWNVQYDASGRIERIQAEDGTGTGDALLFEYDAQDRLVAISTREGGIVRHQVGYGYDALGRLASVTTDLTPDDAADNAATGNTDGRLFVTTYAYVGTSMQLASVGQSDGTTVNYGYDTSGRVATVRCGDETTTYAYDSDTTTVTDGLNRAWIYVHDAAGQLTSVTSPAVDGLSDVTTYSYDSGNLIQAKTVRGAATLSLLDYQYDGNDNLVWQWDSLGNAIQRIYSGTNQVLSETRFTGVDADRGGAGLPAGGLVTRYVYDNRDRLRFVVDAAGGVTEYTYAVSGNGIGQQSDVRRYGSVYSGSVDLPTLETWSAGNAAGGSLTEYGYDLWGRLSQTTAFTAIDANGNGILDAGAVLTRVSYDAHGLMRQQVTVRGATRTASGAAPAGSQITDYTYDGMGRLLGIVQHPSDVSAANDAGSLSTTYAYLDSGHVLSVTQDNGSTRTQVRDAAGRLVSEELAGFVSGIATTRTTSYYYDDAGQLRATRDANGGLSYRFYDAKGRLATTVDSTGAVVATSYDAEDRVVQVRAYANRVDTSTWLSADVVTKNTFVEIGVVVDATNDRIQGSVYDTAGRLVQQTDGIGAITSYGYDGAGRLLQVKRTDAAGTAATSRTTRYFHDAAGRVVGTLDGEGYLTETAYDALGRATAVTRYSRVSPSTEWAAGGLAQLRPVVDAASDQTTRFYYDRRGNQVGVLDAQGYLTESVIDESGNTRAQRRYATALAWQASDTLATLKARAGSNRETRLGYNALGQLVTEVNAEGTVTRHAYDEAGRLVRTTVADGVASEVRDSYRRYNVFDELIGEISGEGAASASSLLGGKALDDATLTQAQLDQAYSAYGIRHDYDVLGRRIETVDSEGNKTWYFYNEVLGRQYTVRGVSEDSSGATGARNSQAEISETRLSAFGEAAQTIAYTGRAAIAVPGSRSSAQAIVDTLSYVASIDSMRQMTYDRRGLLSTIRSATNVLDRYTWNAFGERTRVEVAVGTTAAATMDSIYDRRGLLTSRTDAVGAAEQRSTSQAYDAFGRVVSATDAAGHVTSHTYDRLGRQLSHSQVVQGRTETWRATYDAWGNVLTQVDALNRTTSYAYDNVNRTVVVTTPEGVAITTGHNRHGQTVSVRQTLPDGTIAETTHAYDRDGNLTATTDALGNLRQNEYDVRGLLAASIGADGRRVEMHYDAAGRVLSRVEDPAALALRTTYAYDAQGRQVTVTDASGRVSRHSYNLDGRLTQTALDPAGINQRIIYSYDARGRQVSVTQGATVTAYAYDDLGRRVSETIDPGAGKLNLTTSYVYDDNDNLIRKTGPDGAVTRYYHDEANRQVYVIDPLGVATRNWYDADGRLVASRTFGHAFDTSTLGDGTSLAALDGLLDWNDPAYQGEYRIHDRDGRLRFVLATTGALTEQIYDDAGRLVATRRYAASAWPALGISTDALFAGTALPSDIDIGVIANTTQDEVTYRVLDAAGQLRATVDGLGQVEEFQVDAAGRVIGDKRHVDTADLGALRASLEAGTATLAGVMATVAADGSHDPVVYRVLDGAGRQRYTIDAMGAVTENSYDAAGREVHTRRYAVAIAISSELKAKLVNGDKSAEAAVAALLVADDARDLCEYRVHDAAGRLAATIDGAGFVRLFSYDAAGRVTADRSEGAATPISAGLRAQLQAGTATPAQIYAVDPASNGRDQFAYSVHDAAGRLRYTLTLVDSVNLVVSERKYDAAGRLIEVDQYGRTVPLSGTSITVAGVATALSVAGANTPENQRQTRYVYDADGRLRFTIDDAGVVIEQRYDSLGRVGEQRAYGVAIPTSVPATEAAVAAAVAGIGDVRTTTMAYDGAGRVTRVTDALGHFETYAYDALGNKTSHTDKLGKTWTYGYDAAGRLVRETSPAVQVATTTVSGTVSLATRSIITRTAYDALGNVISRTEDADTTNARTVQYLYDNRGHQVATLFPDAGKIDAASGQFVLTGAAVGTTVIYDAMGRAVVEQDVRGNYSYKIYDARGNLAYDVDQEGNVTRRMYDAFGQQTQLYRYANKIAAITGWSAGTPITKAQIETAGVLVSNSADRTLTTTWDQLGRKRTVVQASVSYVNSSGATVSGYPTSRIEYNAYGEVVKESVLLEGTLAAGTWADTWHYYDQMGHRIRTVDAEGYVTAWQYDARGQLAIQVEFARAMDTAGLATTGLPPMPATGDTATGYDRIVVFGFDALGRKSSESAQRLYQAANGASGMRNVVTEYTYDNADHLIGTEVDGVATTTVAYDALGRAISLTEAARQVLAANWQTTVSASTATDLSSASLYVAVSPYTTMEYDAFGNAVRITRYAKGDPASGNPDATDPNNAVTTTFHDRQGRAVATHDAAGTTWYSSYDAADHLVDSWYVMSNNGGTATVHAVATYDKVGRQLTTVTTRQPASGAAITDAQSAVQYNAFGEVVAQGATLASLPAKYTYDRAGRITVSNADSGANRRYVYNLAGHQVREERDWTNGVTAMTAVYRRDTDKVGRVRSQTLPSFSSDAADVATVVTVLDRWGNVLRQVDPRGFVTEYAYNDRNQVIRQVAPQTKVVDEAGQEAWLAPETRWIYDALGRLAATRDANGHVRRFEYDAAGQLVRSVDATGASARQAYDALGRSSAAQDSLGNITFSNFDRLDRVVAQGDFMLNPAGTARTKTTLQSYALNQNGDRLQVTDALGHWTKYDYDSRSLLVHSQTQMGVVHTYTYDSQGHKTQDLNGLGTSNTWTYDYFGRLSDHDDLGGADYGYTYDTRSGLLTATTSTRTSTAPAPGGRDPWDFEDPEVTDPIVLTEQLLDRKIEYYANGQVRRISDGDIFYAYEYDAAGNRTREETKTVDGRGMTVHTLTRITYDSNNRISRVTTDDLVTAQRTLDLSYDYDAVGNRRRVVANSAYQGAPLETGNQAPVLIGQPSDTSIKAGQVVQWSLAASAYFNDPDGTPLSYVLTLADGSQVPAWLHMTHDAAAGLLTFQADAGSAGALGQVLALKLTATDSPTDSAPLSVGAGFSLSVVSNSAPLPKNADAVVLEAKTGDAFTGEFKVTDYFVDSDVGDTLGLSVDPLSAGLAAWLGVDTSTPGVVRVSGTPTLQGTYSLTLRARDGSGAEATRQIQIHVAAKQAPVPKTVAPATVVAQHAFTLEWSRSQLFTDADDFEITFSAGDGSPLPAWIDARYLRDEIPPLVRLTGTPPANATDVTVKLTATDTDGMSASLTFVLDVVPNNAPQAQSGSLTRTAKVGQAFLANFAAGSLFVDPEGDTINYSLVATDPRAQWLSLAYDGTTLSLSGTPIEGQSGTYAVTLRATDVYGASRDLQITFEVAPANTAPVLNRPIPNQIPTVTGGTWAFTFAADTFLDPEADPLTYAASGMPAWMGFNPASRTFSGTPAGSGSWTVTVTATDDHGHSTATTFTVTLNHAPTTSGIADQNATMGTAWSFIVPAGAFADSDGNALTYSAYEWVRVSEWDPDLQKPIFYWEAQPLPAWLQFDAAQRKFTGTPPAEGTIQLQVWANDGKSNVSATFALNIAGVVQVANPIPNQVASATTTAWSYVIPANTFHDPNGDDAALTYTATGLPAWLQFYGATRTFYGTPDIDGTWTITVTATDPDSNTGIDQFTITTGNARPINAVAMPNQSAVATQAWSYTVPAGTFTDADGDALQYTAVQLVEVQDYEPDPITGRPIHVGSHFEEDALPSWLTFSASLHRFTGTPPSQGTVMLRVRVTDPSGAVAADSFDLVVAAAPNQAPTVPSPIPNQTANATGGTWSYTFPTSTFSDPEGGVLTYTATGMPAWMAFNASTRTFSGVPSTIGSWNITVTAHDPAGGIVADTFTVTTPDAVPVVASAIPNQTATPGVAWSYTFPAGTFIDRNGQALTYTASGMPAWMVFNAGTRTFSGTGSAAGSWNITVTASDGSLTAADTFAVTIGNLVPTVASPIPAQSAVVTQAWSYTVPSSTFSDGNGDALSYSAYEWVRVSEWDPDLQKPIFYWEAQPLPSWLTFTASTRKFTGTPPAQDSIQLQVWANDGHGGNVSDTFVLTIDAAPNQAPTVPSPIPNQTANATGGTWSYTFPTSTFNDPEGGVLTYTATGMPAWMTFNASTRAFSGVPSAIGSWNVTVTAHDPAGATVSDTFTVTTPNAAPVVASAIPNQTATPGVAWSYTFPAGTFIDRNGQALTYTANGMPAWMVFNAGTRTFSGTGSVAGSWNITVTASDGSLTTTDTFTVTVGNLVPTVASPIPNQSAVTGTAWSYTVPSGAFGDGNGDVLSYSAYEWVRVSEWDPDLQKPIFYWEAQPLPSWLTFTASTRKFTGTPPAQDSIQLQVWVNDGHGGNVSDTFTLTIGPAPNQAPTVPSPIPNQTANATGGNWSYTFPISTFSDPEGGALSYTVSGMPTWMTFNASTRAFSGIPSTAGSWNITVTAHDPSGATVSDTFTVTTPNVAPRIVTAIPDKTATVGQAFSYTFSAFADYNDQALAYTLSGMPAWMAFNASTRTLSGTPTAAATYTLTATASDGGLATSDSFVLTVSTAPPVENRAPVVNRPLVDQEEFLAYTFAADTFVDPDGDALTYTYTVSPLAPNISFDPVSRTFSGYGSGGKYGKTFIITVFANDGHGHTASDSFNYHVEGYMEPLGAPTGTSASDSNDLFATMRASSLQVETDTQQQMLPPDDGGGDPPGDGGTGGTGGTTVPNVQELWFTYDAENRVQVVNGEMVNGQIVVAADDGSDEIASYALQYDAAGNAISRTTVVLNGNGAPITKIAQSTYNARGQLQDEYASVKVGTTTGVVARHTYDAAGHETEQLGYYAPGTVKTYRTGNPNYPDTEWIDVDISGRLAHATTTTYDNDGRVSLVGERGRSGPGWLAVDGSSGSDTVADLTALSNVLYSNASGASGYDAAGRLTTYRYQHLSPYGDATTGAYTHTYTTTYEARDTYLEKSISGTSSDTNYKPTTTTSTYDPTGRRVAVTQTTPISGQDPITRLRYFSYDADGGILTRRDGTLNSGVFTETANSRQHYAYANGQQVATLGEDGTIDAATQLTAFDSSDMGTTPALVLEGDTLQSIAQRVYGNSSLWYVLAAANAVTDADLVPGTTLQAPEVKTTANDASTFKPFDPNSIVGPTTPSLPYIAPPPQQHCDGLMTVLMVAIAVIVTVYTAGAAAGYFGATATATGATGAGAIGGAVMTGSTVAGVTAGEAFASAAIGGFMGSAVSQEVGKAIGAVDHFSLRGAVASGLTAGVTAGIGGQLGSMQELIEAGQWGKVAASGALASMGGYAANRVAGIDASFSWRSVAADALSAVVAGKINKKLGTVFEPGVSNGIARDTVSGLVGGVVSVHVHRALGDERAIDYGQIAADAFGNALGNAFISTRNPQQVIPQSANRDEDPFGQTQALEAWEHRTSNGLFGDGTSFLDRNPYATASLTSGGWPMGSMDNGDRPRSNAIDVSPVTPAAADPSIPTLGTVVVTGDRSQDAWFMAMWDWSNQYHMAPPPATGDRAALVQYWSDATRQLAPVYNQWLAQSTGGVINRTPVNGPTMADFEQQWRSTGVNGLFAAADDALAAGQEWFHGLVENVNEFGGNTDSTVGRMFAAGEYAVIQTVDKVASGILGMGRLMTNPQMGVAALQGVLHAAQDPLGTAERGWAAWSGLSFQERAEHAAAILVTLPLLLEAGATQAGQVGRLSETVGDWGDLGVINSAGVSETVALARARQFAMLEDNIGFNISPTAWDQYPTIGRSGTFVTDRQGVMRYFDDLGGASETTISRSAASQIEKDMGLVPGTLQEGFKVRQVTGLRSLEPASPLEGNQYFLGAGNHLPGGAPEMVIRSIPTIDNDFVNTLLKVKVGH